MKSLSASQKITQQILVLQEQLITENAAIKDSIHGLTEYFKPLQIAKRTIEKVSHQFSDRPMLDIIVLAVTGIATRKLIARKTKNILIRTAVKIIPFLIQRFVAD